MRRPPCLLLLVLSLLITACRPAATPTPQPTVTPLSTQTPEPTLTPGRGVTGDVEGLVMLDNGNVIIGVEWLSKSRVTYRVLGGDVEPLRSLVGETVHVQGEIVDHGLFLKEITVSSVQVSSSPDRLSMRRGFIKETGVSIYMQGTHVLTDREGIFICLLAPVEGGPDLNEYMRGEAVVYGVLEQTVEGNAQIMRVRRVEPAK